MKEKYLYYGYSDVEDPSVLGLEDQAHAYPSLAALQRALKGETGISCFRLKVEVTEAVEIDRKGKVLS
jgi:hypothetical protein